MYFPYFFAAVDFAIFLAPLLADSSYEGAADDTVSMQVESHSLKIGEIFELGFFLMDT